MKFDFDEFARLAKTDPEMFELRRRQILNSEILKAPVGQQEKLLRFQKQLDDRRASTDGQSFINYCMKQVSQNLEDLEDQWRCIQAIATRP